MGKWLWKFNDNNENLLWKELISNRWYEGTFNLYHTSTKNINNFSSHFRKSIILNFNIYNLGINNVAHSGINTSFWHESWLSAISLKV